MNDETAAINALARLFYHRHGYQVPEGYRFDKAHHPQERSMWSMACDAYDVLRHGVTIEELMEE